MSSPCRQTSRQISGDKAEQLALDYLQRHGLNLVSRNFRCKVGEIDLILLDQDQLVFVEVRFRNRSTFGCAAASVTPVKQRKLIRAAQFYLMRHPKLGNIPCRFDVIGIDQTSENLKLDWITNAFQCH